MSSFRIQFSFFIVVFILYNCSSTDTVQPPESNFYALSVGNSWDYKWYGVSNEGNQSLISVEENISIVGIEEINGNSFYKFKRLISGNTNGNYAFVPENGEHYEFYRDSLGFLINEEGLIKFTNSTYEEFPIYYYDIFGSFDGEDIGATLFGKLSTEEFIYESEIGDFSSLELITRFEYDNGVTAPANNHIYYSDGIGLISDDIVFIANNAGYRRVLVNYDFPN